MVTRLGAMELMASLSREVGIMSKELVEVFMELARLSSSGRETGEKLQRDGREVGAGQGIMVTVEEEMFALTVATLPEKCYSPHFSALGQMGGGGDNCVNGVK